MTTTGILLAAGAEPALLELLGRLGDKRAPLLAHIDVLARPECVSALEEVARGTGVIIHRSPDVAADLAALSLLLDQAPGDVLVADAGLVVSAEVPIGLLADPRLTSAAVCGDARDAPDISRVRVLRGRVLAASSVLHRCRAANADFLELLKVGAADTAAAAAAARELSGLVQAKSPAPTGSAPEGFGGSSAAALLLVGLVRSGRTVKPSHLMAYFWSRPGNAEEAAAARRNLAQVDEARVKLDSVVKGNDSFFTTYFVSPYSKYVARWCARRGLTPNFVTTVSLLTGLAAAGAFAEGSRAGLVLGAVLLQVAFMLDCVDGQLARYTRRYSEFGSWLDSVFDRAKEYAVFAGLAYGAARADGSDIWHLSIAALTLQTTRHMLDFGWSAGQRERVVEQIQPPLSEPDDAPPTEGIVGGGDADVMADLRSGPDSGTSVPRLLARSLVAFPIGERFAVISLAAAIFGHRVPLLVVLVWGGAAVAYATVARLRRSRR